MIASLLLAAATTATLDPGLLAGVAQRPLDPFLMELPALPSDPDLRARFGPDAPPLSGYGDRLRGDLWEGVQRWLAGDELYSHLFEASTGTLDPACTNEVTALVLRDASGTSFYWVKVDLIGAFQDLRAELLVRLRLRGLEEVSEQNLLLAATHTHGGFGALSPRGVAQFFTVDRFSRALFDAVVDQLVEAVVAAEESLAPAVLGVGGVDVPGVSGNRRDTCARAGDPPNPEPDRLCGIVRIDRPDGTPLATVFRFAVHGTSYGGGNLRFTPDNMGYAERAVERGGGGVGIFLNGAEGDVAPRGGNAIEVGERLGAAVLDARAAIAPVVDVRLASACCFLDDPSIGPTTSDPCPFPLPEARIRVLKLVEHPFAPNCFPDRAPGGRAIAVPKRVEPLWLEGEGAAIAAFRIDAGGTSSVFATLPGEPLTALGLRVQELATRDFGFDNAFCVGLANAHLGYLATEDEYEQGGYEAALTLFGPTQAEVLVGNAAHVMGLLAPEREARSAGTLEDLAELLEPIRERHSVPALGALLLLRGEVTALGATGVRAAGDPTPATAGDLWHLGSCTKAMTATLVAVHVERGTLAWDTTVGEVFAGRVADVHLSWSAVTVEQLLAHRGGAPADLSADGLWSRLWRREGTPREQRRALVEGVLPTAPLTAPDAAYLYSNAGYALAGAMLEELTDTAFEDLMRKELFQPLGMRSAGFGPPGSADTVDQPRAHRRSRDAWAPVAPGPEADNPPAIGPAGTVHATLADWAKFVAAHVGGARGEGGLVAPETFARLHAPRDDNDYALGWGRPRRAWAGGRVLTHAGSNTMWYCVVWAAPQRDGAVLVACNAGGDAAARACDEVAAALASRFLD